MRGEMSLVGPRPELPSVVHSYEPWQHMRHVVKPGITGLWQVTARNDGVLLQDCTDLDVVYAQSVSLRHDLRLVAATFRVVADVGRGGR
jgi:lipopolysaccharide/colanic/teichoic acid biosynthesis glycosyltransferase